MPRRREIPKREILPDPKYSSIDVAKFVNVLMQSGKKSVAERMIYGALEQIKKKTSKDPLEVFNQAVSNVRPMVEVKSRRVGGANYQVPVEVRPVRRTALAMRWIRDAARSRAISVFPLRGEFRIRMIHFRTHRPALLVSLAPIIVVKRGC